MPPPPDAPARLLEGSLDSDLVPSPVQYAALLPPGLDASTTLPVLLFLHGNGADQSLLGDSLRPLFERGWNAGALPPCVVITPAAGDSFYLDFEDGSQLWESFLIGPFVAHLRQRLSLISTPPGGIVIAGASMGGLGALRLAFKHPDRFAAVAALEPVLAPALRFGDVGERHRFWHSAAIPPAAFGDPVLEAHWQANHPPNIALERAGEIRSSGLAIYLEAGDRDFFNVQEGCEFLHRVLWDRGVDHEYHLVHGADHVGAGVLPRVEEALDFIGRVLRARALDPAVEELRRGPLGALKREAEARDPNRWRGEFAAFD